MREQSIEVCRELIVTHFGATNVDWTYRETCVIEGMSGIEIGFDGECNGFRQYVCVCENGKIVIDECIVDDDDGERMVRTMTFDEVA